ncbi:MAG TPA: cyclic nucleotide-binding protein [Rhodobacteraceae bacterium]|jgi:CRP-like cAMP-binding protein|nr:cyclic nucleotide-binding protein [Paracoccaceae bacterium]
MKPEFVAIARKSVLLATIPPDITAEILAHSTIKHFDRHQTIFIQGDNADFIYIVLSGWLKLFRIAPSGAEAVVTVLTKGHSFGEAAAFKGGSFPVSAEASTECELIRIPAKLYMDLMRKEPDLALSILAATFAHLHSLVIQVEQLKANTAAQRVAQFLCELCACETDKCDVILPFDKVLIAGRLGIKPESLSRAFSYLKKFGVKVEKNHATIESYIKLREFAGFD